MKCLAHQMDLKRKIFGLPLGIYFLVLLVLQTYLIFHHNPRIQPLLFSLDAVGLTLLFYFIRYGKSRVCKIYIYFSLFFLVIVVMQFYLLFHYVSEIQLILGSMLLIGDNLLLIFLIWEYAFFSESKSK